MMDWGWGDGGGWLAMGLTMVLWLAAAIVVVWLIVRALLALERRGGPGEGPARETPEEILRRRFAAGEIDAEEFRRRMEVLRGGGSG